MKVFPNSARARPFAAVPQTARRTRSRKLLVIPPQFPSVIHSRHGWIDGEKQNHTIHRRNNFLDRVTEQISDRADLFSFVTTSPGATFGYQTPVHFV